MAPITAADPIAKGIIPTMKQALRDLLIWRQRVVVTSENGETYTEWHDPLPMQNPISLCLQLSARDWLFFLCGFAAWTVDAYDFHALSIQTTKLAAYYNRSKTDITTAITLTLLLRSVGAAFFGLAGDKYGRKWPLVMNMVILGALQIGTIFCSTFQQFLAVRSLFGMFMGGVYGNAIAMALDQCPSGARGLMSGILQQGYAAGYVFAACGNLGVGGSVESWKTIFWIGAGLSFTIALVRACFPESRPVVNAQAQGHDHGVSPGEFFQSVKLMLREEWRMCIYCVLFMTWFNYLSHTSQDSYTTFMLVQKELENRSASIASILMQSGAFFGGAVMGYLSQSIGRRRSIILSAFLAGCLIPAWILPTGAAALSVTGFVMQFFVQGAWGAIPIHLNELSPPAFRSTFPGLCYQLGNMISSPSAQIVNAIAESTRVHSPTGDLVEAYGPTMGISTAIVLIGMIVTTSLGPEKRGRAFDEQAVVGPEKTIDGRDADLSKDEEMGVLSETVSRADNGRANRS
ncbi:major facilitator superfamily domain-containing protein [Aspergillus californicus]